MRKDLENNIKSRLGEIRVMNCGEECEIIQYNNARDITVKFLKTGEEAKGDYGQFKKGSIKSHFTPTVYNIGVVGLETTKINGKNIKSYDIWNSMLQRCYDEKLQQKHPTYIGCKVCNEWLYYSNFKKWFNKNYYEIEEQRMHLDKDILKRENKIYSPETCVFVPERINSLFTKSNATRGDLPIGVSWIKETNKYRTVCSIFDIKTNKSKNKHLGCYNTPNEAFESYKNFKEKYVKQVAEQYKGRIPSKLYDAMINYKVEITD